MAKMKASKGDIEEINHFLLMKQLYLQESLEGKTEDLKKSHQLIEDLTEDVQHLTMQRDALKDKLAKYESPKPVYYSADDLAAMSAYRY